MEKQTGIFNNKEYNSEKDNNVKKFLEIYNKQNLDFNKNKKPISVLNPKEEIQINNVNQINHVKKNILLTRSGNKTHIRRDQFLLDIKNQSKTSFKKIEEREKKSNGINKINKIK